MNGDLEELEEAARTCLKERINLEHTLGTLKNKGNCALATWLGAFELTTFAPLEGAEYDCYLVPASKVVDLLRI